MAIRPMVLLGRGSKVEFLSPSVVADDLGVPSPVHQDVDGPGRPEV